MIKPFYTDISALAANKSSATRTKNFIQSLLSLWNTLTLFKVTSLDNLKPIIENPVEQFVKLTEQTKKVRDGEPVRTPEGFNEINRLASELRQLVGSLDNFKLDRGTVDFSPHHYRRQVNNAFFFAATPLQQKRLKYAESVVRLIKQQEDFYVEEKGDSRSFRWSPVPTGVRLHYTGGKITPVVDEKWVTSGFEGEITYSQAKQRHEPFGDFRIAISESGSDMVLLEPGDSAPKDFQVIAGHFEFIGKSLVHKDKNLIEKVNEVFS
jgi:hypothetical protein